VVELVDTLS